MEKGASQTSMWVIIVLGKVLRRKIFIHLYDKANIEQSWLQASFLHCGQLSSSTEKMKLKHLVHSWPQPRWGKAVLYPSCSNQQKSPDGSLQHLRCLINQQKNIPHIWIAGYWSFIFQFSPTAV